MARERELNSLVMAHYRPIEAAIRWSGLFEHEADILQQLAEHQVIGPDDFPQWPNLRANLERLYDALADGELPFSIGGGQRGHSGDIYDPHLKIHHLDLKRWMRRRCPVARPEFLFSANERAQSLNLHKRTNAAVPARAQASAREDRTVEQENSPHPPEYGGDFEEPREDAGRDRRFIANDNLIHTFVDMTFGHSASGKPNSRFRSKAEWIDEAVALYGDRYGISKRTLERKFAEHEPKTEKA